MKKLLFILPLLLACNLTITGPTIDNVNTNTNTNTNDIHDIGTFQPSPSPTTPVPTPTGGSETPLNIPPGSQAIAERVPQNYIARCGDWTYLDAVVSSLRSSDPRWGYLIKGSGEISHDVIAYRATSDNIGAWGVDVIIDYCGASKFGWNVIGFDAAAQWTGTRF